MSTVGQNNIRAPKMQIVHIVYFSIITLAIMDFSLLLPILIALQTLDSNSVVTFEKNGNLIVFHFGCINIIQCKFVPNISRKAHNLQLCRKFMYIRCRKGAGTKMHKCLEISWVQSIV